MGLYEHWPYVNFHELNLNWILEQLKTVRDEYAEVQQLVIDLEDLKNKYLEIYALYDELNAEFISFKKDVNDEMSAFEADIQNQFNLQSLEIQNQFLTLSEQVTNTLSGFNSRLIDMDIKLDNAIENLSQSLTIINPFTGIEEPIAQVIYMLASFHMEDAITAGEYDGLMLTAGAYDALALTAYQYDVTGKQYLMP